MQSVGVFEFPSPERSAGERMMTAVRAVLRMIVPVLAMFTVFAVAYFHMDRFVTSLDFFSPSQWQYNPGYWLSVGHLILPLSFLASSLTNRRYGEAYATAQVLVAWGICGVMTLLAMLFLSDGFTASPFPPMQITATFVVAFMFAQIVQVSIFDKARGRTWWGAPLYSTLWASLTYVIIFHPIAAWGMGQPWMEKMMVDFVIKASISIALLVPYYLMRSSIKPMPGYGGA